jgi:hypothetical protein
MVLITNGKNQGFKEEQLAIFDDLNEVMYISISPYETIESLKDCGR